MSEKHERATGEHGSTLENRESFAFLGGPGVSHVKSTRWQNQDAMAWVVGMTLGVVFVRSTVLCPFLEGAVLMFWAMRRVLSWSVSSKASGGTLMTSHVSEVSSK